jgi:hypothetical protein
MVAGLWQLGRKLARHAALVLILVLVASLAVACAKLAHAETRAKSAALKVANEQARADSWRSYAVASDTSKWNATRLVEQVRLEATALAKAYQAERAFSAQLALKIRDVEVRADGTSVRSDSAIVATFDVRNPPFSVHAVVTLPDSSTGLTPSIDLNLNVDAIALQLDVLCLPPDSTGIRRARVNMQTPSWLVLDPSTTLKQSPDVCGNAVRATPRAVPLPRHASWREWLPRHRPRWLPEIVGGYGVLASTRGVSHGPAIVVGYRIL